MLSEFVIGRHTHANTIGAFRKLAPGTWWRLGGIEGVFVLYPVSWALGAVLMALYAWKGSWMTYEHS